MIAVEAIYISAGHNFFGRHGQRPGMHRMVAVDQVECVAGKGLMGDRFFDYKPDYKGQITFFSREVLQSLWSDLNIPTEHRNPAATRRNVITSGIDLNQMIGQEFELQGITFLGTEECRPCYWMNGAICESAEDWMRGRGGLRAKILTDGNLAVAGAALSKR